LSEKREGLVGRLGYAQMILDSKQSIISRNAALDIRIKDFIMTGAKEPWKAMNTVLSRIEGG